MTANIARPAGILDLFAGPGGWDTGLDYLGYDGDLLGIEWDEDACDTARAAGHPRLLADISKLDPHYFADIRGLIASPPCQGFSMAGKGKGRDDSHLLLAAIDTVNTEADVVEAIARLHVDMTDDRSVFVLEPLRWALALTPDWTAWEQVPAVLPIWEACAKVLRRIGYSVEVGIVHAEQFGVPQTRRRAILVAHAPSMPVPAKLPTPTHSRYHSRHPGKLDEGVQKWVSMAEGIGWGLLNRPSLAVMTARNRQTGSDVLRGSSWAGAFWNRVQDDPQEFRARAQALSWGMTHRPSMTVTGGGTGKGGAEPFGNGARQSMLRELEAGRWQFAGAGATARTTAGQIPRDADRPAHTITGKGTAAWTPDDANRERKKSVRVTVQEAAVLQSFPANYPWQGNKTAQYRQCGDAVPPVLAASILRPILEATGEVDESGDSPRVAAA